MFFKILKRDLKRKAGMNIIITLFIILATMFLAGSVSNVIASITGVDRFMDMAGFTDGLALVAGCSREEAESGADRCESITGYRSESCTVIGSQNVVINGDDSREFESATTLIQTPGESEIRYYKEDGSVLTDVNPGEVYLSAASMNKNDLKTGDRITVTLGGRSRNFTVAGIAKDAATGSKNMDFSRLFLSPEDYHFFTDSSEVADRSSMPIIYFSTEDYDRTEIELGENLPFSLLVYDRGTMKFSYAVDTIIAAVLFAASIILIVIAFVMVRFTIRFTVSEEFREIGVMKSIGMKDRSIRGLYIAKYVLITAVGVAAGLVLSFPFGNLLSGLGLSAIVVENSSSFLINLACALMTALITLLFCYASTKEIRRMSPVDAIRSAQTGERTERKSPLKLQRSRSSCAAFMAVNDILSSRKQFAAIGAVFALFVILTLMISTIAATFESDGLFGAFGMTEDTDVLIDTGSYSETFLMQENGQEHVEKYLKELESKLAENGIPAKCVQEILISTKISKGDCSKVMFGGCGVGSETDMYEYTSGSAPQNETEIALASNAARLLEAEIGDTVQVEVGGEKTDCLVSGIYESLLNMGKNCRLYSGTDRSFETASGLLSTCIIFTDRPGEAETERRIEQIRRLYPDREVNTRAEYVDKMVGISDMMHMIKLALLFITLIIIILVVMLMERTLIIREKTQIALLKAEGFTNGFVLRWQLLRFVFISIAACIVGIALSQPATELIANPIFRTMGLKTKISYDIPWTENLLIYPLTIIGVTLLTALLTALGTKKIRAVDTAGID